MLRLTSAVGLGLGCAAIAFGLEANAIGEPAQPFRVEYRAPASCPDEASLVSRIRARVDVRTARPGEPITTFDVTLRNEGDKIVGRIASTGERSEPTSREVSGTDCSDVVDAVALIMTMAIAPGARIAPSAAARANFGSMGNPNTPDIAPPPMSEKPEPATAKPSDAARFRFLASAQAEATLAYVPTTVVGAGGRIQMFRSASYVGGPSVAIGFVSVPSIERQMDVGRASLGFDVGELFACPLSFAWSRAVTFLPCGRIDVGRISATGMDIPNAHSESLLWASAGVLGQIAIVPVKPLVIDAQASLIVPLTPYKFIFKDDSVIYGAQSVGFSTSLALGVMFL